MARDTPYNHIFKTIDKTGPGSSFYKLLVCSANFAHLKNKPEAH
jgi:hypothetical protein